MPRTKKDGSSNKAVKRSLEETDNKTPPAKKRASSAEPSVKKTYPKLVDPDDGVGEVLFYNALHCGISYTF